MIVSTRKSHAMSQPSYLCTQLVDVVAAVLTCARLALEMTVCGGGHGVAGAAVADDLVMLSLTNLRSVVVDAPARTARVGGGALWDHVLAETERYNLGVVTGLVSHTGVGGLTLGGGYGYLSRAWGLSCDALLEATVVLASGEVVVARPDDAATKDLFWGLCGGGGNFGVVTEFVFRLRPVPPTLPVIVMKWDVLSDKATSVLCSYADWCCDSDTPRRSSAFAILDRSSFTVIMVDLTERGNKDASVPKTPTEDLTEKFCAAMPVPPQHIDKREMTYRALNSMFDEGNKAGKVCAHLLAHGAHDRT